MWCSNEFVLTRETKKFCDVKCSQKYKRNKKIERVIIFDRDGFSCKYCGRSPMNSKTILHIDHKIPKSRGGKNEASNFITSCQECNLGKSDILLDFWKNK